MFESSAAAEEPDAPVDGAVSADVGVMVERLGAALDAGVEVLRSLGSGTEVIAALGALPPGPLAGALLASVDAASLSDGDLIDLLKAQGRQIASLEAGVSTAMAAFAGHRQCAAVSDGPGGPEGSDGPDALAGSAASEQVSQFAADEIAAALCLTRFCARDRMENALDLTARLPGTLAELARGRIDAARARVITQETRVLDEPGARTVENAVLARAPRQTPTGLRASCRRAVLRADPAAAGARQQQAEMERTVRVYPLDDGMAELCWRDRADRVLAFSTAIEALAKAAKAHQPQDGRDLPQRRADVLADLGDRLLELPWLPRGQGARPQVNITVPLGTMLNLSSEPAQLTGYGPIPAELARAIAAEGTWRRLLTDPATGALLDVGRDKYRPPAALREFVLTRDQYCQGLGCTRPARAGDIDHRIDWAAGGHTRASDLDALCRHTHQLKHQGGWTRVRRPDGATIWTTPTGHAYLRDPDWLPGATPPAELTSEHRQAVRAHAASLGIILPEGSVGDDAVSADPCEPGITRWSGPAISDRGIGDRGVSGREVAGLDAAGLDAAGLDAAGLDAAGLDAAGLDAAGLDAAGLDAAGLDAAGLDAAGRDDEGRDAAGRDDEGRDAAGRDDEGRDAAGRDDEGRGAAGRDDEGRDAAGRDDEGRDAAGRDAAGRDAAGRDVDGPDDDNREIGWPDADYRSGVGTAYGIIERTKRWRDEQRRNAIRTDYHHLNPAGTDGTLGSGATHGTARTPRTDSIRETSIGEPLDRPTPDRPTPDRPTPAPQVPDRQTDRPACEPHIRKPRADRPADWETNQDEQREFDGNSNRANTEYRRPISPDEDVPPF